MGHSYYRGHSVWSDFGRRRGPKLRSRTRARPTPAFGLLSGRGGRASREVWGPLVAIRKTAGNGTARGFGLTLHMSRHALPHADLVRPRACPPACGGRWSMETEAEQS